MTSERRHCCEAIRTSEKHLIPNTSLKCSVCDVTYLRETSITRLQDRLASFETERPCTHWQFYPTRVPFANGSRRVARVHTASTASGSSGALRPHQDVFAVDANGTRRLGSAV